MKTHRLLNRLMPCLAALLAVGQLLLVVASWLYAAAFPSSSVRSLLSGEGVRFFMGRFSHFMSTPVLVWLLLLAMACGCLVASRLFDGRRGYSVRSARTLTLLVTVVMTVVVVMLTAVPHALLLSATGRLLPSPFLEALVPATAFVVLVASAVYGLTAGTFRSLHDVYSAMVAGLQSAAPLILFYVLVRQLYASLLFVFCR